MHYVTISYNPMIIKSFKIYWITTYTDGSFDDYIIITLTLIHQIQLEPFGRLLLLWL